MARRVTFKQFTEILTNGLIFCGETMRDAANGLIFCGETMRDAANTKGVAQELLEPLDGMLIVRKWMAPQSNLTSIVLWSHPSAVIAHGPKPIVWFRRLLRHLSSVPGVAFPIETNALRSNGSTVHYV
jgi:hypothetical protein